MSIEDHGKGFRIVTPDIGFEANLLLEPDTRNWQLFVEGSAAGMLAFFMDSSEGSILSKFYSEAQFDRLAYRLSEDN
jgi:hypothetical protein